MKKNNGKFKPLFLTKWS